VIFYKIIIRRFLKYFSQKYLKIDQFKESFVIEKDFHISIQEKCPEIKVGSKNEAIEYVLRPEKIPKGCLIPLRS